MLTAHYDTATNMASVYPLMKLFGARVGQFCLLLPIFLVFSLAPQYYFQLMSFILVILGVSLLFANRYNYNDNSSGLLTISEHVKANRESDKLFYALTDNEEKGLFGAKALRHI